MVELESEPSRHQTLKEITIVFKKYGLSQAERILVLNEMAIILIKQFDNQCDEQYLPTLEEIVQDILTNQGSYESD